MVLAFPCNQFGGQEPWDHPKIKAFAQERGADKYHLFQKIDVNGGHTHPTYEFLKKCFPGDVTWNFSAKFVIDRDGSPLDRYNDSFSKGSQVDSWSKIEKQVETLLSQTPDQAKL